MILENVDGSFSFVSLVNLGGSDCVPLVNRANRATKTGTGIGEKDTAKPSGARAVSISAGGSRKPA